MRLESVHGVLDPLKNSWVPKMGEGLWEDEKTEIGTPAKARKTFQKHIHVKYELGE